MVNNNKSDELVAIYDWFKSLKHSTANQYAFTEQGVAMLSSVLRSDMAIKISIQIMDVLVIMLHFLSMYTGLLID